MPRPKSSERRLGQHGQYWLSKRSDSEVWQRTWHDKSARRTRRSPLGTTDFQEADRRLAEFVAAEYKPVSAPIQDVFLSWCLVHYWNEHAAKLPSAEQARIALGYWTEWWGTKTVQDVTLDNQKQFVAWLGRQATRRGEPLSSGYISRIMSSGRAAIRFAHKHGAIASAPFVMDVETKEDRRQKEPKGRPLAQREVARLLDEVESDHLWRFCVILLTTMCRPDAAVDLTPAMIRVEEGYINLLPPGRKQTKKRRPIVPLTDCLAAWLDRWAQADAEARQAPEGVRLAADTLVHYHGASVDEMDSAWRALRAKVWPADLSALPPAEDRAERRRRSLLCGPMGAKVNPYSFRHTLGRELRRRRVPADEISLMLGHLVAEENDTTGIYSPHDPDYCSNAKAAIDAYLLEIDALMKRRTLFPGRAKLAVVETRHAG